MTYDPRPDPTLQAIRRHDRVMTALKIALAGIVVLISGLMVAYHANAAVTTTTSTSYALRPCSTCREIVFPTEAECRAAAQAEAQRAGATRESGSAVYTCITRHNVIATFRPNPVVTCPAAPAPRPGTCPTGTTGSWTQTATVGPAPECAITWSTQPAGACVSPTRLCSWQIAYPATAPAPDGFRIVYGERPDQLARSAPSVAGTTRTTSITMPGPGTWYIAMISFKANATDSPLSNILTCVVPQ